MVNLAKGREPQRFRLQDQHQNQYKDALWLTVDLPVAIIEAREKFITPDESHLHVAASALDTDRWTDTVPADKAVLIAAQGLLQYVDGNDVKSLFGKKFPGASFMFDLIAKFISDKTMTGWHKTKTLHGTTHAFWCR